MRITCLIALIIGLYIGGNYEPRYIIENEEFATDEVVQAKLDKIEQDRLWENFTSEERIIFEVFGEDAEVAIRIAKAESGLNCRAVGDSGKSIGLFQINKVHWHKYGNLYDCRENARAAYDIYKASFWYPWSVYKNI